MLDLDNLKYNDDFCGDVIIQAIFLLMERLKN